MTSSIYSDNLKSLMSMDSTSKLAKTTVQAILDDAYKSTGSKKFNSEVRKKILDTLEIDYDGKNSEKSISNVIKKYTETISKDIEDFASKNKNNNKSYAYGDFSKKTYENVGMQDYYNMKSIMNLSQAISSYSKNYTTMTTFKLGSVNIPKSNFTINL